MTGFLDKLFGRNKNTPPQPDSKSRAIETAPLHLDIALEEADASTANTMQGQGLQARRLDLPQFIVGVGQSVGKQRDHNEDALFTLTTNLIGEGSPAPFGLYIIADGMGGHQHGEIASSISMRAIASHIVHKMYLPHFGLDDLSIDESIQEIMQEGTLLAHQTILKEAQGSGTTLTAALVIGDRMTIAHVGDSRAYVIHKDGRMQAITHDHSLVKRLEELGQITAEEAAIHPQRNVLYRALGQGEPFEPDVISMPIPRDGYLLICSDGLWGVVNEREIFNIISTATDPQQACQLLIEAANTAGGPDNISVILVRLPE